MCDNKRLSFVYPFIIKRFISTIGRPVVAKFIVLFHHFTWTLLIVVKSSNVGRDTFSKGQSGTDGFCCQVIESADTRKSCT